MKKIGLTVTLALAMAALVLVWGTGEKTRLAQGAPTAQVSAGDVVINEVAWMGTANSDWDEWIEFYNSTDGDITLTNWTLTSSGSINIILSGIITAHGHFLLERDDCAVNDILADQVYGGQRMGNTGETLVLRDEFGNLVDTANSSRGHANGWAAGTNSPDYTMERINPYAPDSDANWATNDGLTRNGHDALGAPINGTPRAKNSAYAIPGLAVDKSGPAVLTSGLTFTCRIAISNTDTTLIAGVIVTDILPSGLSFVTQTSILTFSQPAADTLVWQAGTLPAGALQFITLTLYPAGSLSGIVTNIVTATEDTGRLETATWSAPLAPYVRLYALHPQALHSGDEAAALINLGAVTVTLNGWGLSDGDLTPDATFTATLPAGEIIWLTENADDFRHVFGFDADAVPVGTWPGFANDGDEALLFDGDGNLLDTLVYGSGVITTTGWNGAAVPYPHSTSTDGEIIYRKLDQATGIPVPDTNTAADWAQSAGDDINGKKLRYPGWDLEEFFFPAQITQTAALTVWVAPDGLFEGVAGELQKAQSSILIEGYTFESAELTGVITELLGSGISVTMLLEGRQEDQMLWACGQMAEAGAKVYFMHNGDGVHNRYKNQHAKFIIVDGQTVLIGSENFSPGGMPADDKSDGTWGHRGVYLATDATGVVERAQAIFYRDLDTAHSDIVPWGEYGYTAPAVFTPTYSADWISYTARFSRPLVLSGEFAFEVIHSPENSLRDHDALLGLLARAGSGDTILIEQLYERQTWDDGPNPRLEAYIAAARRGASVQLLLDSRYDQNGDNQATADYVNGIAAGEGLYLEARPGNPTGDGIHNKMVLAEIGGRGYIHVGSINGSEVSSKANRELALQVQSDEAYEFLKTLFEQDWQASWQGSPHVSFVYLPLIMRNHVPPADHLVISELLYDPSGTNDENTEWIEIYNPTAFTVTLSGYSLSDGNSYGDGKAAFPSGSSIGPGEVIVVAQKASGVGFTPDYELKESNAAVPNMTPLNGGIIWGNNGDEAILRDSSGADVDVLVYGSGSYAGVTPHPGVGWSDNSLERKPPDRDTDDCSADFWERYTPNPGQVPLN